MIPEVVLPPEGLAADVARVGPLVRVRPLVYEQVVALGELAVAELADELLLGTRSSPRSPYEPPVQMGVHLRRSHWKEPRGR